MKGIVVERKKRYAIMMTAEGGFYKTKIDSSHAIGEEVQFTPLNEQSGLLSILRSYVSSPQLKAAAAILLCLAIIYPLLSWTNGSSETYAYVNIDINPSLSFEVDDSYQIIDAHAINEDGSELLSEMGDLQGESLEEISSSIMTLSQEKGYLDVDGNILLGVNYAGNQSNNNDTYLESLSNDLATEFNQDYEFTWFEVPNEIREQAEQEGTSMNILFASNQLMNQTSDESDQDSDQTESSDHKDSSDGEDQSNNQTKADHSSSENQDSNQKESMNEKFKKFFERMNRDELPSGLRDKFTDSQSEEKEQEDQTKDTQNKGSQKSDGHPVFGDEGPPGQSKKNEDSHKNKGSEKLDGHPVFGDDGPPGHNKDENESKDKQQTSDQQDRERDTNDKESDEERNDQEKDNASNKSDDHPVFGDDGPPGHNKNKEESEEKEQLPEDRDRETDKKESDQEDSEEEDGHPVFGNDGPPGQSNDED
ncbi:anti-sigma-I factor RsgI family protein [Alkalibacillus salilacus]|uniref:RsgI N-terminal anti-sigma domain-containing protein n=1 Tax=Alkalibacillus salilacus TaxID=284582 RepID=A0ABT9VG02_9BACI|nr:anti-sigma factor domain-containing protein [Alkalibacillus salilacus]MDQ0159897.1 hypothetical protein [Alkalibacillus salilacus]